ncbi:DNA-cytosine methyltransferase [Escherichia coli]|uniref:DNA-cytosine methyltransferase n=1 Tax=Escherichia coli TaxID=562 RepID=A0A376RH63_ECOLX|nr:DNA-cytosine methyltransferase [Escherichia coli]
MQTLDELGYDVADAEDNGPDDPKIIDGKHFCRSTVNASCWWVFVAILI